MREVESSKLSLVGKALKGTTKQLWEKTVSKRLLIVIFKNLILIVIKVSALCVK